MSGRAGARDRHRGEHDRATRVADDAVPGEQPHDHDLGHDLGQVVADAQVRPATEGHEQVAVRLVLRASGTEPVRVEHLRVAPPLGVHVQSVTGRADQ